MPVYDYEAKLTNGQLVKGKIEAIDENAVRASLRNMKYFPLAVREVGKTSFDVSNFTKVKIKDIAIFCRQFSYILIAGMSIVKALEILKDETANKKFKATLNAVYDDVQKGKLLSSSLKKHEDFPDMLVNMVEAGESSGNLDDIMIKMANFYDKEYEQQQKVRQALTYPIIVSIFAIIVVNVLVIKVLPTFIENMDLSKGLPLPTVIVMGISHFMINYWYVVLFGVFIVVFLAGLFVRKDEGKMAIDRIKLRLPIFGNLFLKVATAKFARTFGMLLKSGIPIINSIEMSAKTINNRYLQQHLEASVEDIKKGISISEAIRKKNIFSTMFIQMIIIGEESGTLDDVLSNTSAFYDKESETAIAQMTTMLEPAIIIVLAAVVGFIILAIILPMLSSYDAAGGGAI